MKLHEDGLESSIPIDWMGVESTQFTDPLPQTGETPHATWRCLALSSIVTVRFWRLSCRGTKRSAAETNQLALTCCIK